MIEILQKDLAELLPKVGDVEHVMRSLFKDTDPKLQPLVDHVLSGKGKRLRVILVLLVSHALKGSWDEKEREIGYGAVLELVHTSTLVHDDVIDNAKTRRGKPVLQEDVGNTMAILFGDLLYINAMKLAVKMGSLRMIDVIADSTKSMIEGELLQHQCLFDPNVTLESYFSILERKTAYLFASCCKIGSFTSGSNEDVEQAMWNYGYHLGVAFQLVDDLLDVMGDAEKVGKTIMSDLKEGKLTYPLDDHAG